MNSQEKRFVCNIKFMEDFQKKIILKVSCGKNELETFSYHCLLLVYKHNLKTHGLTHTGVKKYKFGTFQKAFPHTGNKKLKFREHFEKGSRFKKSLKKDHFKNGSLR